jgi:hypothetical protein
VQFGCFVMVASSTVAETTTPKMKAKSNQGHGAWSIRDNSESVPRYAGWLSIRAGIVKHEEQPNACALSNDFARSFARRWEAEARNTLVLAQILVHGSARLRPIQVRQLR